MRSIVPLWTALLLAACNNEAEVKNALYPEDALVLKVEGMHCGTCKGKVIKALSEVEGVEWAQVEYELGEVAFRGSAQTQDVIAAIRGAGYMVPGSEGTETTEVEKGR